MAAPVLDDRKQSEVDFYNKRERDRKELTHEEFSSCASIRTNTSTP